MYTYETSQTSDPGPERSRNQPTKLGIHTRVPKATLRTEVYDKKLITDTDIFSPPKH